MAYRFPELVGRLVTHYDAWIVGSAANPETDLTTVRDFDIIVPYHMWNVAAGILPKDATPNVFRGWKCISQEREVDVWPDDLGRVLTNNMVRFIWHPRTDSRFQRL